VAAGLALPGPALADDAPADDSTDAVTLEDRNDTGLDAASAQQDEPTLDVSVNGSLRFNALFRSYGADTGFENKADRKLGDGGFTFDTFRIGANGSYGSLIFDAEWAFYPSSFGGNYIHHGWVGYEFSDSRQIQVGVSQVPFGIQPYASSSWFFNNTYYVGLEDDYDAGVKAVLSPGNWDIQGAYYMNPEGTTFYGSSDAARYSYDVVPGGGSSISEENQFNIKLAYAFQHGDLGFTKIGVSGQRGQLLNEGTGETDWHAAYAAHLQGRYGGFGAKLEFAQQQLNPPGSDDPYTRMGAYGSTYRVANEHTVYSSSLSYRIPVNAGPISQIKPYYDFSMVTKEIDNWNKNVSHDIGFLTSAGPLFVYTDLIISKNHPFNLPFTGSFEQVMASGAEDEFRTAFNINIGIYF
jgi:hypothetical protein